MKWVTFSNQKPLLPSIQIAFAGLESSLERLDLSGNRLSSLPVAVLGLARLTSLDLGGNKIKQLPHGSAFNGLNRLTHLDLSWNM